MGRVGEILGELADLPSRDGIKRGGAACTCVRSCPSCCFAFFSAASTPWWCRSIRSLKIAEPCGACGGGRRVRRVVKEKASAGFVRRATRRGGARLRENRRALLEDDGGGGVERPRLGSTPHE